MTTTLEKAGSNFRKAIKSNNMMTRLVGVKSQQVCFFQKMAKKMRKMPNGGLDVPYEKLNSTFGITLSHRDNAGILFDEQ